VTVAVLSPADGASAPRRSRAADELEQRAEALVEVRGRAAVDLVRDAVVRGARRFGIAHQVERAGERRVRGRCAVGRRRDAVGIGPVTQDAEALIVASRVACRSLSFSASGLLILPGNRAS
jgi:hypothetical protein